MKKYILFLFLSLLSFSGFAQTLYYASEQDPVLHLNKQCKNMKAESYVGFTMSGETQQPICEECLKTTQLPLYKAGYSLQKSSVYQYAAMGTAIGSGLIGVSLACQDNLKTHGVVIGAIGGVAAFVLEILAINEKYKAGTKLKVSAGGITYTF